jgi:Fe-S-cluster containining protein
MLKMEKKTSFKCSFCGFCCTDETTQINLTLLDIKWLKDVTKMSVKELFFKGIIAFTPFIRTDNFLVFDVELGMKRPCQLYKNNKCEAYDGRPLNCRIFPYWFITNRIEDPLDCIKDVKPDAATFFKYRMYERIIGDMILKQSRDTEDFMKKIGALQTIDFSNDKSLIKLMKTNKKKILGRDKKSAEIVKKLMISAEEKIDLGRLNKKIDLIEEEIKKQNFDKEIDMLLNAEGILDGEITDVNVSYGNNFQNP